MKVEVTAAGPAEVEADALALVAGGLLVRKLDPLFEGRLTRSAADADPIAVVQVGRELRARRIVLVATDGVDPEDLRTAAARAVRACRGTSTVAWALDDTLPMAETRQLQADRRGRRARQLRRGPLEERARGKPAVERFVVCGVSDELPGPRAGPSSSRAGRTSPASSSTRRRTSSAPAGLAERAAAIPGLRVDVVDAAAAGLPALAAVGRSSTRAAAARSSCATSPRTRARVRGSRSSARP